MPPGRGNPPGCCYRAQRFLALQVRFAAMFRDVLAGSTQPEPVWNPLSILRYRLLTDGSEVL